MSKKENMIAQIRDINPTASVAFLESFTEQALQEYLSHLGYQSSPRAERAMWIRRHETPAMTIRKCA